MPRKPVDDGLIGGSVTVRRPRGDGGSKRTTTDQGPHCQRDRGIRQTEETKADATRERDGRAPPIRRFLGLGPAGPRPHLRPPLGRCFWFVPRVSCSRPAPNRPVPSWRAPDGPAGASRPVPRSPGISRGWLVACASLACACPHIPRLASHRRLLRAYHGLHRPRGERRNRPRPGPCACPNFARPLNSAFSGRAGSLRGLAFGLRPGAVAARRASARRAGGVFAVFVSPLSPSLRVGGWCPASAFFRHVPGRVSSWPVLPSCRSFARPRTSRGCSGWGMGLSAQVPARVDHRVPGAWIALCGARRRRKIDEKDAAHALLSKHSKEVNGGDKKLTRADSRCYNVRATKSI